MEDFSLCINCHNTIYSIHRSLPPFLILRLYSKFGAFTSTLNMVMLCWLVGSLFTVKKREFLRCLVIVKGEYIIISTFKLNNLCTIF